MLFDLEEPSPAVSQPDIKAEEVFESVDFLDQSNLGTIKLDHHAFLIPDIYSIQNNKALFYILSQKLNVSPAVLQNTPDVMIVRSEKHAMKNSISVEDSRAIVNFTYKTSLSLNNKVIIIDNIDNMRDASYNVLLKSIEEPPHGTLFFFIYNNPSAIPVTIRSRCILISENISGMEPAKFFFEDINNELLETMNNNLFLYEKATECDFSKVLGTALNAISQRQPLLLIDETSHNDTVFYSAMFVMEWLLNNLIKVLLGAPAHKMQIDASKLKIESVINAHEQFINLKKSISDLNTNRSLALFLILESIYAR